MSAGDDGRGPGTRLNAATFLASALLIAGMTATRRTPEPHEEEQAVRIRGTFAALKPLPVLATAVVVLGVALTISEGTWMVGVPELARTSLGADVGAFSLVMAGWAVGSITAAGVLARRPARRKALGSMLAWTLQFPAYVLLALAGGLPLAIVGAIGTGLAHGAASVLITSAAQEEVPDRQLGRVLGLLGLVDRGAHATGLVFVGPLFALVAPEAVFAGAGVALFLTGLAGAAYAARVTRSR